MTTERHRWGWPERVLAGIVAGALAYFVTGLTNFWSVGPEARVWIAVAVGVLFAILGPAVWELFSLLWW